MKIGKPRAWTLTPKEAVGVATVIAASVPFLRQLEAIAERDRDVMQIIADDMSGVVVPAKRTPPDPRRPLSATNRPVVSTVAAGTDPLSWQYGGNRSMFPYTGARAEAAYNLATLVCPPVSANVPHTDDVLRWPCDSCKLWAADQILTIVNLRLRSFPRDADAESCEEPPKSRRKTGRRPPRKPARKPRRSGRRG